MVINIRGTYASGKSTIVRSVMERYKAKLPFFQEGRRRPIAYGLGRESYTPASLTSYTPIINAVESFGDRPLYVPGHYEIACGGCDTISKPDDVYALVTSAATAGFDVLYEGVMIGDDFKRARALHDSLKTAGTPMLVIQLTTPLETCYTGIRARREARGDDKPLSTKKTIERDKSSRSASRRLREAGVEVLLTDRDTALTVVLTRLGWVS